jgi:hypothetical protein
MTTYDKMIRKIDKRMSTKYLQLATEVEDTE